MKFAANEIFSSEFVSSLPDHWNFISQATKATSRVIGLSRLFKAADDSIHFIWLPLLL